MGSPSERAYPTVQAKHYKSGRIHAVDLIVVHCTASLENPSGNGAEATARYFQTTDRPASAHVTVDQNSTVRSVHDWDTAYAAKNFNARGLHLELVGMADQTRAQWLDPISKATLQRGASVVADWIVRSNRRVNARYMTIAQLKGDQGGGITFHADCSQAMPSTGHSDPGTGFPRDVFLDLVKAEVARASKPAVRENPYLYAAKPVIFRGSPNNSVRFVQWALGLPVDGVWGSQTETAVRALQHKHRRPVTGQVTAGWTIDYLKAITR